MPTKAFANGVVPGPIPALDTIFATRKSYLTSFRLGRICVRVVCYTDEKAQESAAMTSLQNGKVSLGGTFL